MAIVVLAASNPAVVALRAEALRRAGIDFAAAADLNALKRTLLTIRPDAVLLDLPGDEFPGLICGPPEAGAAVARPHHRFLTASSPPGAWLAAVHALLATPPPLTFDAETVVLAMGESRAQLPPVEARLRGGVNRSGRRARERRGRGPARMRIRIRYGGGGSAADARVPDTSAAGGGGIAAAGGDSAQTGLSAGAARLIDGDRIL